MTDIHIRDISKIYPQFRLEPLTLTLPHAMVVGLIGENGAGKTTLMKMLLGITRPSSGTIFWDEKPFGPELLPLLGFMIGHAEVWERMKAPEVGRFFQKVYPLWDQERYLSMLHELNTPLDTPVSTMSTGNQQKVQVAAALAHEAQYLFLDEPTAGLDPIARRDTLRLIHREAMDREMGVLISSHITTDLESIADYLVMIHQGHLLLEGPKDELLETHHLIQWPSDYDFPTSRMVYTEAGPYGQKGLWCGPLPPKETVVAERPTIEDLFYYYTKAQRRSS